MSTIFLTDFTVLINHTFSWLRQKATTRNRWLKPRFKKLLSRNFCEKMVAVKFHNFHTVFHKERYKYQLKKFVKPIQTYGILISQYFCRQTGVMISRNFCQVHLRNFYEVIQWSIRHFIFTEFSPFIVYRNHFDEIALS